MLTQIRNILLFTTGLAVMLTSCASSKKDGPSYRPLENALLWKIEAKGVKKPSYLFGTIHIIDEEDFFLPKGTEQSIQKSEKVVFEIDMKEMNDVSAVMGMMGKIFMKDNKTISDLLSPEDYALVSNFFQNKGLPIFMLERMKPMFLTIFTYGDFQPDDMKNGKLKSYEMEFMEMAQNSGKATGGLESIEFQINIFDKISYDVQAAMLVEAIKSRDGRESQELESMVKMYRSQNIELMAASISQEGQDMSGFEETLLTERNKNWIPLIAEEMKRQPTFFAVGAGHLAGKQGVIHLLRKSGLKVSAVK
jgi:uncharacterized protein YbaP (TraB family)